MKRILFFQLICLMLVVSAAWGKTVPATQLEKVTLQLKWKHQFQFAGYYAAIEKGYYRDAGLDVELQEWHGDLQRPVDLVSAGKATFGIDGTNLLTSRLQGKPLVALAAIFQHSPSVAIALQDSSIKTATDMHGKRVMSYGGVNVELSAMLMQEGIPTDEVVWLPTRSSIDSLITGETDLYAAYLTDEPYFLKQKQVPYTIINPLNYGIDFYADILFTSGKEISEHPQRVKAFREASLRGWGYAVEHPEEIIDLILSKYRQDISREHLLFEAEETIKLVASAKVSIGHINPGRFEHMADMLKKLGRVDSKAGLNGFVYDAGSLETLTTKEKAWLSQNHRVEVFVAHAPPLVYIKEDRVEGLVIDYLNRLTTDFGVQIVYRTSSWNQAINGVSRKTGPDVIPIITPYSEYRSGMVLSAPYLSMPFVIFTRADSGFVGGINDLAERKVALQQGFLLQSILVEECPQIKTVPTATIQDAVALLAAGEVDAYIGSLMITSHTVKEMGWENIKVAAPVSILSSEHVLAARNDWPELVSLFNRLIRKMTPHEHAEIRQRWLPMRYEHGVNQEDILRWGSIGLVIFLLCSGLFIIWNRVLKKEIKQRMITEEALVGSILQFQQLLQAIPHGIIEIDQDFKILYCNPPFAQMLGYTPLDLINVELAELLKGDDALQTVRERLEPVQQDDAHLNFKLKLVDKWRNTHVVQFDCDSDQKIEGGGQIIVVTDLTRQKQAEKALQESEAIYKNTFENVQAGVAYLTTEGCFTRVNKYLCQMLGYSDAELRQLSYMQITHPDDLQASQTQIEQLLDRNTETFSLTERYKKKDGSYVWGLVSIALLPQQDGKDCIVAVIQNIDEIKRQQADVAEKSSNLETIIEQRTAELKNRIDEVEDLNLGMLNLTEDLQNSYQQLEQKSEEVRDINKELEAFAYSVSHDLRAPLRHVQGFSEILLENSEQELSESNRLHLVKIKASAEKMEQLIDDLLAFSRAGRSELQLRPVDTAQIVKEIVSGLNDIDDNREIDWQIDDLPMVTGDLATLRQVFTNLLENAVKYSSRQDRPEIRISFEQTDDEIVFCVSDNGVGFNPDYTHKLFGVFSRLHRTDQFEGTGIGLANVKRVVKRHGGRVWAESSIGAGARFYFSLPDNR